MRRSVVESIAHKRDGGKHDADEIRGLISGFVAGDVPDYQMAAWLMAAYLRGLDGEETVWLTEAMAHSGDTVDMSPVGRPVVDKHSTGGVGDKTTLVVAPIVAGCGVPVGKMSGRGLGHTGGTLDKLEAIPGYRVSLPVDAFVKQVADIGLAVISQTPEIAPADKLMYALRDVTGTVPSIPLIVGSIISKKVAGGADGIVLDVKYGSGAFMKSAGDGRALADELVRVGRALGKSCDALLEPMDEPLGLAVGNALEVREAVETLRGDGPEDLVETCVDLAAHMLVMGGAANDLEAADCFAREALRDGRALEAFERWVAAQGGDARVAEDPAAVLPSAPLTRVVASDTAVLLAAMDAAAVGRAAMALGAGRLRKDDPIDLSAGIVLSAKVGSRLGPGEAIATLHASSEALLDVGEERFRAAVSLAGE